MHAKIQKSLLTFMSILLLLVIVIWALLSVNGRSVNPNNPQSPIQNSGAIRILKKDLDQLTYKIYLNNIETQLNENTIRNLNPGKYNIRLEAEKYNPWEADVNVVQGFITEIIPYLFSKSSNLKLKTLTPINIDSIYFSPYSDYAYFVVYNTNLGSEKGIWKIMLDPNSTLFSTNNKNTVKILNIDPIIESYIKSGEYSLIPSPDETYLLFKTSERNFILSTESIQTNSSKELINIEEAVGFQPQEIYWFGQGNSLVVKDNKLLAEYSLSTGTFEIISYNPLFEPVYGINADTVYYVDQLQNQLISYTKQNKTIVKLENQALPSKIQGIWVSNINSNYIVLKAENIFYFIDLKQSFIDKIDENINIVKISPDGKSLLYSKGTQLISYYLSEINPINSYQPIRTVINENYVPENFIIKFNNVGSHLLILKILENKDSVIEVMEKNGQNNYTLFKGNNLVNKYFSMLNNNKELILLLKTDTFSNSGDITQNLQKNNLYYLDLEV